MNISKVSKLVLMESLHIKEGDRKSRGVTNVSNIAKFFAITIIAKLVRMTPGNRTRVFTAIYVKMEEVERKAQLYTNS